MKRRDFISTMIAAGAAANLTSVTLATNPTEKLIPKETPALDNQYRSYIIDHHSPDPPIMRFDKLDPQEHIQRYKDANLDHVWLFTKGHHGEAYYPTKIGHPHPGLKFDYVGVMSELLRKEKIAFHAYYSIGYDTYAAKKNSDWAMISENGKPVRMRPPSGRFRWGQWHLVCVNSPYRQYVFGQLSEIIKGYNPDGIFLDIVGQEICYCSYCQKLYQEHYGREIPKGNEAKEKWREIEEFKYKTAHFGFTKAALAHIRSLGSKARVTHNANHLYFPNETQDLFDYTFDEPWAGNYVSAMFTRGLCKFPQIGPGMVSTVYDTYPESVFIADAAMIAAQNCRPFFYSSTIRPDGSLNKLWFKNMGVAFRGIQAIQPHLRERDSVKCIAVIHSEKTKFNDQSDYQNSLRGAMEIAVDTHFPSDVLADWNLEVISKYQAVLFPEATCISDKQAEIIRNYVKNGGLLIAVGLTGMKDESGKNRTNFALADLFGVDFVRLEDKYVKNYWGSYLNRNQAPIWNKLPDTQLVASPPYVVVKPNSSDIEVMATHLLPALQWDENDVWLNWEPPMPDQDSGHPAIISRKAGSGKVIYATFDLFKMQTDNFNWTPNFVYEILRENLKVKPMFVELQNGRKGIGTTFYKKQGSNTLVVHQVNRTVTTFKGAVKPFLGGSLLLNNEFFRIGSAKQIHPVAKNLTIKTKGSYAQIELPQLNIHNVFLIEGK
ncbi:MAG TPA: beta-galactosidase trimerization domain-containing protein [Pyrinomonadaceae bacterium]|nr:beta-galactosidase trimerization domain-containing protein [Pyrinomonadaceae bacterium]